MASIIKNLYYVSPYAVLPPGVTVAGITLQTDPAQSPTPSTVKNPVLVIRLSLADTSAVVGISATSGASTNVKTAFYQPPFPLSATQSYMVDIIWVSSGTPPENINWDLAITSAPITAAQVTIESAGYNGTAVTAKVAYGASSIFVAAQVNVYVLSGGIYIHVGSAQAQGNFVTVPVTLSGFSPVLFLSAQAVIPATNAGGSGTFSAPFSQGPPTTISQYSGIPQSAKGLSSATYDGKNLTLAWTLNAIVGCVSPVSSLVQLFAGGQLIGSFNAGPQSAAFAIELSNQQNVTAQVSTVSNGISSTPISFSLITQAPLVTNVTANKSASNITATVLLPTGLSAKAYLMDGNTILAGPVTQSAGQVTFPYSGQGYNVEGMVGLSIVAVNTSSDLTITGPQSSPAVLLSTVPQIGSGLIRINPSNAAQWLIDLSWNRLPDAAQNIASYTVNVLQGATSLGTQTTAGTAASIAIPTTAIDVTKVQSITLSAKSTNGGSSPLLTLTAVFAPPLLTSVKTTQGQIGITWTAPVIPPANQLPVAYQPVVLSSGSVIYTGSSTPATSAALPLSTIAIPTSGSLLVMVNVSLGPITLQTNAAMAASASAVPLLAVPVVNAVTVVPTTNKSQINWVIAPGASAYTVSFMDGKVQTGIATNAYLLTAQPTTSAQASYTVMATGTSNGVPVTGPASAINTIPTITANVTKVRFNGSVVYLSWDAVAGALAYNYTIYDHSGTLAASGTTGETTIQTNLTPVSGKQYTAYVQPVTTSGTGLAGHTQNIFGEGIFLSQQPASTAYPYLYAAANMANLGTPTAGPVAQDIVMYLPELGVAAGALGSAAITIDPFTIAPSGNAALPYKLTIAGGDMAWKFDTTTIRTTLQSNYIAFLKKLEKPGDNLTGSTAFGISIVKSAIAAMLPQTFAEQLYYNFGFSTTSSVGAGYIDLLPGMVLRVYASDYISIAQNRLPTWINGYAGATIMDFEIGSYNAGANWSVGFDGFLNTLSSLGALSVSAPVASAGSVQAGIANAADLYFAQFVQPFYRIYFPSAISNASGTGSNTTSDNFTIVAASSYTNLQNTSTDPSTSPTAYFRGRAIVEVMIKILVNGNERLVPAGTSIGNLLDQLGLRPSATASVLSQLRVYRSVVAATYNSSLSAQQELRLDWNGLAVYGTGNGLNALSAPLLPGDEIFTEKI